MTTLVTEKMNETVLKLAIETYANLTQRTTEDIINEIKNENRIIVENIIQMMFLIA